MSDFGNKEVFSKNIKKFMEINNVDRYKLAEALDVSVAYISRIERGSTEINLKRLTEICHILKISLSEILDGTSSNSSNYLFTDFNNLLKNCPPEKIELIYKVAKTIVEN